MNSPTNGVHPFPVEQAAVQVSAPTRPFYWAVRRELWENRWIYIVPMIVSAVVLLGSFIHAVARLPKVIQNLPADPLQRHVAIIAPFGMVPAPIMFATLLVGLFYAVDALYGERRDRSILFWKSLPVSDRTTVLAKAAIPMVVLPLIAFALSVVAQLALLILTTPVLAARGVSPGLVWGEIRYPQEPIVMIYGLAVHALWFAPVYCWLLLVGAWARRAPLLWGVLLPMIPALLEAMAGKTQFIRAAYRYRFLGAMVAAFTGAKEQKGLIDRFDQLTPGRFLGTGGLWFGLVLAALFLIAAVRLRRRREPL
jgi:ABC-2 type transport system permease protein